MGNTKYLVSFTDSDHNAAREIVTADGPLQAVACAAVEASSGRFGVDVSQRTITVEEY